MVAQEIGVQVSGDDTGGKENHSYPLESPLHIQSDRNCSLFPSRDSFTRQRYFSLDRKTDFFPASTDFQFNIILMPTRQHSLFFPSLYLFLLIL